LKRPIGALAAFRAAGAVTTLVLALAEQADSIAALIANEPLKVLGLISPAALAWNQNVAHWFASFFVIWVN
jgi:non-ribosomal peptide synthetase component E (peptide arylation enzyme)